MSELMYHGAVIGIGGTIVMDIWAVVRLRLFGVPSLDYAIVGRWVALFAKGQFFHHPIFKVEKVPSEKPLGWGLHYLTGVVFAICFLFGVESQWVHNPKLTDAIIFGLLTCVVPFFIMQPAFGIGVAASKTPNPVIHCFHSVVTHLFYGTGLYLTALCVPF